MPDNRDTPGSAAAPGRGDIAVIGAGCRYAGGVHDLQSLWHVILRGRDVTSAVPPDRWDTGFLDRDRGAGTMYCGRGGFLDDVDGFDARFFGITPREAAEIDPQHRLLLTTAWQAMEDSGVPRDRWEGSRTGVFTGILGMDYTLLHAKTAGPAGVGPYYASGKEASFGAGRIAYTFGLHGPCMMVSTACSSSLLAVHLACQALRAGECDAALAGGVNLMLAPELSIFMSRIEALSPTEASRPFDTAADGVVRGEGCGMVVLKRYADAVADGDRVLAVLKGSATVHDGHSAGLIAPNAEAQETLVRSALTAAGVTAADIDYVETHCTGTPLGDRLELSALAAVFTDRRPADRPLLVGSHKANFGHTDSAAGVLGLLKGILVARHGTVPPQINVDTPVPLLRDGALRVATEPTALPGDGPWTVGVSAFGLSGTNVHVVVQSPPRLTAAHRAPAGAAEPVPVLLVSGPTPEALSAQIADYRDVAAATGSADLPALLHSASVRRTHHDYRLAVTGTSGEELATALDAHLTGTAAEDAATGDVLGGRAPRVIHAFCGQGSQWPGMALDLYRAQPVVRDTLDACDALVREFAGWSVLEEIERTHGSRLPATEFAQPAVFAVQTALSRLWTSWGLAPAAVVGHSLGEIAAAHTAGTLTLREAVRLVVARGRIMRAATGSGRMTQVELPPEEAASALGPVADEIVVATVNGPHSVVIAGPADAMERAVAHLKRQGVACLPLGVDYAFHSPAVHPHGDELEAFLAGLTPRPPRIPMLSSVDADTDRPVTDAAYWGRNVRAAVRFWPAVDRWLARRDALFVEIGPHPVLSRPLRDALAHRGRSGAVVSSLVRGRSGPLTLAAALARLHTVGAPVDWAAVHPAHGPVPALPPVPLAAERHWLPGLARGEQGGPAAPRAAAPRRLRAEIRVFDDAQRLVATVADVPLPPAGETAPETAAGPVPPAAGESVPRRPEPSGPASAAGDDAERLTDGPAREQTDGPAREQVARAVGRIAADVLGVPGQRLSRVRGFYELGFDSFSIVELVTRLKDEFPVDLPAGAGLEHPSIEALTEHLLSELATRPPGERLPDTASATQLTAAPTQAPAGPAQATEPTVALSPATPPRATESTAAPAPAAAPAPMPSPAPHRLSGPEPIAIVGMGCRFPGGDGLDAYWSLLSGGVDATGDVPADRWDAAALRDAGHGREPAVATGRGAFVDGIDRFDNAFFRVSAREARSMDPQQRMFLEVAWEALEDAGLAAEALRGTRTGLFVGLNTVDYGQLLAGAPEQVDLYYGTGNTFSGSAGRMSYFLGVRGPSIAVDTACASSLTAVHLGCQSLRTGESDIAVVGGANALLTPTVYRAMSAGGALAPDGRCKAFAATADGYGRGEGAGALVLKTLSRALADGDRVHAVIRGSAVNHNGASGGLTVPSADAQAEVIGAALAQGGVDPAEVDYVEAHGTGTPLGDPVELTALDRVIGAHRPAGRPLLVGSVKTNIAHLEAAAGVAGVIKTVLALRHGEIPPHLHFDEPSRQVPWDRMRLRITDRRVDWPATGRPRTAGVSAFGFTGTNAHVVLAEPPRAPEPRRPRQAVDRPYALAVSATSAQGLEEAVRRVAAHLEHAQDTEPEDLCHTLGVRRSHFAHRLVAVGTGRAGLLAGLRGPATATGTATATSPATVTGTARPGEPARYAMVFGPAVAPLPWERLYEREPAFAAALDTVESAAREALGASVRTALTQGRDDPLTTVAAQIALAALWADHGVRPDALAGRGSGEIAAAHLAGALGLREALVAAAGARDVRLTGRPARPLHLASLAAPGRPLTRWTPGEDADFPARLAEDLVDGGTELLLDAGLTDDAAGLGALAEELTHVPAAPDAAEAALVTAAAALHVRGGEVDWDRLLAGRGRHVSAPGHPWQHRGHWIDAPAPARAPDGAAAGPAPRAEADPPLLGTPLLPYDTPATRHYPVHRAAGPADPAALTELLLAAGRAPAGDGPVEIRDLVITTPLVAAAALTPAAGAHLTVRGDGAERTLSLVPGRHGGHDPGPAATAVLSRPAGPRPEPADLTAVRALAASAPDEPVRERLAPLPAGDPARPDRLAGLLRAATELLASCLPGRDLTVAGARTVRVWDLPAHGELLLHAVAEDDDTGRVRVLAPDGRVLAELDGVRYTTAAGAAVPEEVRQRVAARLHHVRWQPARPLEARAAADGGRWLVAAATPADVPAAAQLAAAMDRAGAEVRAVESEPDWPALLAEPGLRGVILAATAPSPGRGPATAATSATPAAGVLAAARAAVRAVPDRGPGTAPAGAVPRLWLVTRGAQDPQGQLPPDRGLAAAWGLFRVLAMEAPGAWGGCLDLPSPADQAYDAAAARLLGDPVEDELVLRDGTWYAPRLTPAQMPPGPLRAPRFGRDGWYLVVGDLSPLARPVVERLVAAGARRLLLVRTGRGPAGADGDRADAPWPDGVDVKVADLPLGPDADETDADVFTAVTGGEPVAGVVVAPVAQPVRPLSGTEPRRLATAEAFAEWVARLERGLRGQRLDFFYVLGSAAASWGGAGMAVTAALDAALTAVAAARTAAGQAAAVLRWMPHADGAELSRRDLLMMENSGLSPLTTTDVAEAADLLVRGGHTDVSVARMDAGRYAAACRGRTDRAFLELLSGSAPDPDTAGPAAAPDAPPVERPPLVARLFALAPALRGDALLEQVLAHLTDILGEGTGGEVDPERGFFDLGMDSVMAVALKNRLDEELGVDLPATLTFEFPTARALARHLLDALGTGAETGPVPPARAATHPAPDADDALEELSDEELTQRLMAGLAASERLLEGEG